MNPDYVPSLDPDWYEALKATNLPGLFAWVVDRDGMVIDATENMAAIWGLPLGKVIGCRVADLELPLMGESLADIAARRERQWQSGLVETIDLMVRTADRGWVHAVITAARVTHPTSGKQWLLHVGHDITAFGATKVLVGDPAIQGLMVVVADQYSTCVAATDAAARFCGLARSADLVGVNIGDTPYDVLRQRQDQRMADSRAAGAPCFDMEWLSDLDGRVGAYAVTRVGLGDGNKVIILHPVDPRQAFFAPPPDDVLKAVQAPPRLTRRKLEVLVDMALHMSPRESAGHLGISPKMVERHRRELADILGVGDARQVLRALRGTELGHLVIAYSRLVERELGPSD